MYNVVLRSNRTWTHNARIEHPRGATHLLEDVADPSELHFDVLVDAILEGLLVVQFGLKAWLDPGLPPQPAPLRRRVWKR